MFKIKLSLFMLFALSIYPNVAEQFVVGVKANIEQLDKEDNKELADKMRALLGEQEALVKQKLEEDKKEGNGAFKKFCYGLAGGAAVVCTGVFAKNLWQAAQEV